MSVKIKSQHGFRCDVTKGIIFKTRGEVFLSDVKDPFTGNIERGVFNVRINNEFIGWCSRYDHAVEFLLREMKILVGTIQS